ncbi:hypothetical protein DASC09_060040 [Saccharomycopsis crataegensis]|uniref:Thioredoxin-like fold domain-containing protein n=1 Tax=Saccharomycopsis crataegensis TaxID=43959 RepID=A0AAV5QUN1_9ASCO|nr:hypothetical protein DASC09_060040 [Saccharomycopsis crataegensis]
MSIPPKFSGLTKIASNSATAAVAQNVNSVDIFVDFVCPFSRKLFVKFDNELIPLISEKYPNQFKFIIRPVVQPWHAFGSSVTSEALLAINKLAPTESWNFTKALMEHQRDYFDTAIINNTRNELYQKISKFAVEQLDLTKKYNVTEEDVYKALYIREKTPEENEYENINNEITNDLKYFVRFHRALSVHVTPTISVNGVIAPSIESSTSIEDLEKIFKTYL